MSHAPATLPVHHNPKRAAWAVRIQFFVAGALGATWGVHVPTVKVHYALGEQALAAALLAAGVGALLALVQAGRLIARRGPRVVAVCNGLACALAVAALLGFRSLAGLLPLMLGLGIATSLFDVAINAEATDIEHRAGRPLMSGFHGMFSLGGMTGAAVGAALLHRGIAPVQHLLGAALACAVFVLLAGWGMPRLQGSPQGEALSLPRGPLALIGLLAALGLISEGAMYDWSVLFLKQERGSDPGTASLAYASFSAAMAAARFGGDWIRARMSPVNLLRASGLLGAAGMGLALAVPSPVVALLGFALVGLGFANVVPVLFSAASRLPGIPAAHGIAAVSSMGYLGLMAGPPLIGVIAEHRSLSVGLSAVVMFALVMTLAARRALPRP